MKVGWSMRRLLFAVLSAWSALSAGELELKCGSFTLRLDGQGRPQACSRARDGAALLRPGAGQEGFALVAADGATTPLPALRLLPAGRLEAASADGRQAVVFAVAGGARHLAFRIVELRGLEPEARDTLKFTLIGGR
jgi:hypothetical protein